MACPCWCRFLTRGLPGWPGGCRCRAVLPKSISERSPHSGGHARTQFAQPRWSTRHAGRLGHHGAECRHLDACRRLRCRAGAGAGQCVQRPLDVDGRRARPRRGGRAVAQQRGQPGHGEPVRSIDRSRGPWGGRAGPRSNGQPAQRRVRGWLYRCRVRCTVGMGRMGTCHRPFTAASCTRHARVLVSWAVSNPSSQGNHEQTRRPASHFFQ